MATKRKVPHTVNDQQIKATDLMLNALEAFQDQLNEWELGFVSSLTDWFYMKGKPLTDPQFIHLEKLYRKFF